MKKCILNTLMMHIINQKKKKEKESWTLHALTGRSFPSVVEVEGLSDSDMTK